MILYDYYRSSAAYRVRIALNLKKLTYQQRSVNLKNGEQATEEYRRVNSQGLVPTLVCDDGSMLSQSNAICEYIEELYPRPRLLPADAEARARVRCLAGIVACDVHPIANLRVQKYLQNELDVSDDDKLTWVRHWVMQGLFAFESLLDDSRTGSFCHGKSPTLADVFLVPQFYNAVRFECDLTCYPRISAIVGRCESLDAFVAAQPHRQPDAP